MLIAADLWLAQADGLWAVFAGIALWGAHMALTQGIFARMIADAAPEASARDQLRRLLLRQRRRGPARQPRRRLLWDRGGPAETFTVAAGVAALAGAMLWLLPDRGPLACRSRWNGRIRSGDSVARSMNWL